MPVAPKRPCAQPGCPALVDRGRCPAHQKAAYKADREARGSAAQRGYDARWRRYREWYLNQHPLCAMCEKEGRVTAAVIVDHVVPVQSKDDPRFYDETNHQGLCVRCNAIKTTEDKRKGLTR